ncbi:hypothetical protein KCH_09340 [Kitasatospora cheerisanensis KCTC 2395]|uniref:Uncharacterized protein n=1 Tax=Kitasatospora cheerisanensis KCTC 2395 TaxID=1348663 RepID=A0A066Z1E0_9ACTN|nr:hypothetical protein KCH_09340 [Kitasatospora cheerisanensis KCTC 2395]
MRAGVLLGHVRQAFQQPGPQALARRPCVRGGGLDHCLAPVARSGAPDRRMLRPTGRTPTPM